jgi:drug/metabolite transporter (DMT)-like permease
MSITGRQLQREQLEGILLVNLATLTWATNMTLGRWLRNDVGPLTLAAARFFIASLIFLILLRRRLPHERLPGQDRWLLLGMALSGVVLFSPMLYLGLRFTSVVNATLINSFGPLITGVLAAALIAEPMSRRQITGALAGLIGVLVLLSKGSLALWDQASGNVGDVIVLGAVSLWAMYSVLGRKVMQGRSAMSSTALSDLLGLPILLVAALFEAQGQTIDLRPQVSLAILYIGIVPTVIGFLSWNTGVRRLGASGAMVFYNTLPLYGALLGFLLLGESITLTHVLGGALIIGGGLWAATSQAAQDASQEDGTETKNRPVPERQNLHNDR